MMANEIKKINLRGDGKEDEKSLFSYFKIQDFGLLESSADVLNEIYIS